MADITARTEPSTCTDHCRDCGAEVDDRDGWTHCSGGGPDCGDRCPDCGPSPHAEHDSGPITVHDDSTGTMTALRDATPDDLERARGCDPHTGRFEDCDGRTVWLEGVAFDGREYALDDMSKTTNENDEYTYTIFDGNPAQSGQCAWPGHEDEPIEAASPEEALAEVLSTARDEASGCEDYRPGDRLWAIVWDVDGTVVAEGSTLVGDEYDADEST